MVYAFFSICNLKAETLNAGDLFLLSAYDSLLTCSLPCGLQTTQPCTVLDFTITNEYTLCTMIKGVRNICFAS